MNHDDLIKIAIKAKENSYSPYSHFKVGAAVLVPSGKVYTGTNVENSSYGATICAERAAIFKAVSEGERKISVIAITSDSDDYIYPCGICSQVMLEFLDEESIILCSNNSGHYKSLRLKEIMPWAFSQIRPII